MKILVTGAKGFVGKNLCAQLNNIKDGKAKCYGDLTISDVYEYDIDSTPEQLMSGAKIATSSLTLQALTAPRTPRSSWRAISALQLFF